MKKTARRIHAMQVKKVKRKTEMTERLYICQSALELVLKECRKFKQQERECTGSLAGTGFHFSWIITHAAPAGPNIVSSYGGVASDAAYQNRFLADVRSVYPLCLYQGDFHLHPMYFPGLSDRDRTTCRQMLLDQYNRHLEAIPVLLVTGQKEECHAFVARLTPDLQSVELREIEFQVVPDGHFLVRSTLGLEEGEKLVTSGEIVTRLTEGQDEAVKHRGLLMERTFFQTEVGMNRLRHELEILRERFGVPPECSQIDQESVAIRMKMIREILILLPPEFPLNSPSFFYTDSRGRFRELFGLVPNWNSLCTCADVIEKALKVVNRNKKKRGRRR